MKSKTPPETDIAARLAEGPSGNRKNWKRRLIAAVLVLAAAAIAIVWVRAGTSKAVRYQTQPAERGNLTITVAATGTLQPTNTVDVSSELSGIVESVAVDYNDRVKVGQVLLRLDTTKLDAQVQQSTAALAAANGKLLQIQATVTETAAKLSQFRKVRELSGGKVPSQAELDAAEAALARARADEAAARATVSQAQAALDAYKTDLSKTVIRSPISGVVLTRSVEPGQTVASSFQAPVLFHLAEDLTEMELHVDVDEADVGQVREGQEATFSVDAYPNRTYRARIVQTRYGAKTVDGVVTYETVLKVDNPDLSLRPGMTATAEIVVKKLEDVLLVPNAALRFTPEVKEKKEEQKAPSRGLVGALMPPRPRPQTLKRDDAAATDKKEQRVWTLRDGKPVAVPVRIGTTNGSMSEVVEGELAPGTALIVEAVEAKK